MKSRKLRLKLRILLYGIFALVLFGLFLFLPPPTSEEIRVDCGDVRYTHWGIPVSIKRQREPERSKLLTLASELGLKAEWVPVGQPRITNARQLAGFYIDAVLWETVDGRLCRLMIEDLAGSIKVAAGQKGVVPGWLRVVVQGRRLDHLPPHWRYDPMVVKYCQERGYDLPREPRNVQIDEVIAALDEMPRWDMPEPPDAKTRAVIKKACESIRTHYPLPVLSGSALLETTQVHAA